VAQGECRIDARLVDELLARRSSRPRSRLEGLTPRQRDILADVAAGKSNQAIATSRNVTLRAVEKHVSEIFGRLGLATDETGSRRVRAALIYLGQQEP
jgi:DNA-binding NarL/FixJ family response regulator